MIPTAPEAAPMGLRDSDARRTGHVRARVTADLAGAAALCLISLALGVLINSLRAKPLPWVYQTPQHRLQSAVEKVSEDHGMGSPAPGISSLPHEIRLDEFQKFVTEHQGTVLDARPAVFFAQGHVPGATNLPRETFDEEYPRRRQALEAHKSQEIAIYCSGADCPDSQLIADALAKLGYQRLLIYTSGWDEWSQSGLPQEMSPTP